MDGFRRTRFNVNVHPSAARLKQVKLTPTECLSIVAELGKEFDNAKIKVLFRKMRASYGRANWKTNTITLDKVAGCTLETVLHELAHILSKTGHKELFYRWINKLYRVYGY